MHIFHQHVLTNNVYSFKYEIAIKYDLHGHKSQQIYLKVFWKNQTQVILNASPLIRDELTFGIKPSPLKC